MAIRPMSGDVTDVWTFARDTTSRDPNWETGGDRIGRVIRRASGGAIGGGRIELTPLTFGDLHGWAEDNHAAALAALARGADVVAGKPLKSSSLGVDAAALGALVERAASVVPENARAFFEAEFAPHAIAEAGLLHRLLRT